MKMNNEKLFFYNLFVTMVNLSLRLTKIPNFPGRQLVSDKVVAFGLGHFDEVSGTQIPVATFSDSRVLRMSLS